MAQYQSSLTGPEIDAALTDMARHDSEAWAVGTRDGEAVSSLDITYHNNAEYYATKADAAAARAESAVPAGTAGAVFFDQAQSLTDAQKAQVYENIGVSTTNANLADNPWFRINQRQITSVTNAGTTPQPIVDRWNAVQYMDATVAADHITITSRTANSGTIGQNWPEGTFTVGQTYIISINVGGTIYSREKQFTASSSFATITGSGVAVSFFNSSGNSDRLRIRPSSTNPLDIYAVKIEKGTASTLALESPPPYAIDLLNCQRYLYVINSRTGTTLSQVGPAIRWSSGGNYRVSFPLPVPLRASPTVTIDDVSALKLYWQSSTAYACTSLTATNVNTLNVITITVACASISSSAVVAQFAVQAGHALIVSAEI